MQMTIDNNRILHQTASHLYIKPHLHLQKSIAHYTLMQEDVLPFGATLSLVPDVSGCIVLQLQNGQLSCEYWGPTTNMVDVMGKAREFSFFIEFQQGGAYRLFQYPLQNLLNVRLPLSQLHPQLYAHMVHAFEENSSLQAFLETIETYLLRQYTADTAMTYLLKEKITPRASLQEVSERIGYSHRHIQRLFLEQMGCSMKQYQRIQRINHAVQLLQASYSLTEVAQYCGYYDQSHFIHDFNRICGCTPTMYQKRTSAFYQEQFKF